MDKVVHLSLSRKDIPTKIDVVQYATLPYILFVLDDYMPGNASVVSFYIQKPDGTKIFNACEVSSNQIRYKPTTQSFTAVGLHKCQLQIVEQNGTCVSFLIAAFSHENIIDSSAVESQDEFTALEQALRDIGNVVLHNDTRGAVALNGNLTINKDTPIINLNNGSTRSYIASYPANEYGNNVVVQPGGNLIIGGGEYPTNRYNTSLVGDGNEELYLGSDKNVYIESNAGTIENARRWTFASNGDIILPKNNAQIDAIDKDGNVINNMFTLMNGSNNLSLGYGSFENQLGETNIYSGKRMNLFSSADIRFWVSRTTEAGSGHSWWIDTNGNIDSSIPDPTFLGIDIRNQNELFNAVDYGERVPRYYPTVSSTLSVDVGDGPWVGYITNNKADLIFFFPTSKSCSALKWDTGDISPFKGNMSIRGAKGYINGTQTIDLNTFIMSDEIALTATCIDTGIKLKVALISASAKALMSNVDNNTPIVLNGSTRFSLVAK